MMPKQLEIWGTLDPNVSAQLALAHQMDLFKREAGLEVSCKFLESGTTMPYDILNTEAYEKLQSDYNRLQSEHNHLQDKHTILENHLEDLQTQLGFMQLEYQKMSDRLALPAGGSKPFSQPT